MNPIQGTRRDSREYAFLFFYHLQFPGIKNNLPDLKTNEDLMNYISIFGETLPNLEGESLRFALKLIRSTLDNQEIALQNINDSLKGWKLERIAKVDLTLLLLGYCELKFVQPDLSVALILNEYIEMAKKYGTEDSYQFVNGVLDRSLKK